MRAVTNYHAGRAAEIAVAQSYVHAGAELLNERWRGKAGEVDLILRDDAGLVFVEVKKSKTHARAAESLSRRQQLRIFAAAEEYMGATGQDPFTDMRFDVALMDDRGEIEILENAMALH